ncbi:MAG TPA: aminopeptidase P N-terminal domain-containing protein [Candidatus Binatia bacterium]|nr:aminopeptidase P N-terminal domain-containing protein [Candidatus Binatia bacterium]
MTFKQRRARFAEQIGSGIAIVPAAVERTRNADTHYEFRQDSDFFYLTGFNEPDAVLILAPQRDAERDVLFLRPRDRSKEIWDGKRLGVEDAPAALGVDAAHAIDELDAKLPEMLVGHEMLYYALGRDEAFDRRMLAALERARWEVRRGGKAPQQIVEPGIILHEMRLHKDDEELATMRRAAAITRLGHVAAMESTRPGKHEYELEALLEYTYHLNGAQSVAYPSIVAGGDNATILHYNSNRDVLHDKTLVLVDSAAELDNYASDVTRTWPVSGRFSPEQRAIYEIVLRAQKAAIEEVRPGKPFDAYHQTALRVLCEGLIDLGILKGSVDEALEQGSHKDFYMHRTGHFIGIDVHDVGRYRAEDDSSRILEPGMVMTVEPGLYFHRDVACDERFKGIGVRIEDDILCSVDGPVNLSPNIPKEIGEIESLVGSR